MENPKLSIIIPVYNTVKYIERCFDSVLQQTFKDFEMIIIDDGSDDGSEKIVDDYALHDDRITVIHQKNSGIAATRNAGLNMAKGDYISFVDSDDYLSPFFLERLITQAVTDDAQMVMCGYFIEDENEVSKADFPKMDNKLIGPHIYRDCFLDYIAKNPALWNKIFSRKVVEQTKTRFRLHSCEDLLFCLEVLPYFNNVSVISDNLYYYVQRNDSVTHSSRKITQDETAVSAFVKYIITNENYANGDVGILELICIRMLVGFLFSAEAVGQNFVFFLQQVKVLRKWGNFTKFCKNMVFGNSMNSLTRSDAISKKLLFLCRIILLPCIIHFDSLASLLMLVASRKIIKNRRSLKI